MAGRGPAPKEPEKRRRGTRDGNAPTVVTADGETRGPDLPIARPSGEPWPTLTRQWWDAYRTCPQAQLWSATDWQSHLVTAELHAAFWGDGETKVAAELRLREARMGATYEDRLRLRIRVDDGGVQSPSLAAVTDLPDYRTRLAGDAP